MRAGANMTSIKRAGRITTFGFAVGAGLLIAGGAGAAVASAAPDNSGHNSTASSSAASSTASSARSARSASGAPAKAKPTSKVSVSRDSLAPVVQLSTRKPSSSVAAAAVPAAEELSSTPAPAVKQTSAQRLPTPARVPQAAVDVMRDLNTLRRNIELLIRNQIDDLRDNLTMLRYDLAAIIAPARRPTNPDIPADETPGVIGTPKSREGYFIYQGDTNTCALSTAAMLIGQLYGRDAMPTWEAIVSEAASTQSYATPGAKIYDRVNDTFVNLVDVIQLLQTHGVDAKSTNYTRGQGAQAVANLKAALARGDAVAVSVKSAIIYGSGAPDTAYRGDHLITVLGIDTNKNLVYVNDPALVKAEGMGLAIPMNVFLSG